MTTQELDIEGMHCKSCEKAITRALAKADVKVDSISHADGKAVISHNNIDVEKIEDAVKSRGYKVSKITSVSQNSKKQSIKRNDNKASKTVTYIAGAKQDLEKSIIIKGIMILVSLTIIQLLAIALLYSKFPGYKPQYLLPLALIPTVITTNMIALWHQRAYAKETSCMTGMMVGMTIGMMSGFGIGAIAGLVNGMFWGSLIGTAFGMAIGTYAGYCCGIMGMMEGMMAGLMSGTMGAMLTVMMILDHAAIFLVILIALCTLMLAMMMRMTYEGYNTDDGVERKDNSTPKPWSAFLIFAISLVITIAISSLLVMLPKGLY